MRNVRTLHDRVVVKEIKEEQELASGIIIEHGAKEVPRKGTVLFCGPGYKDEPTTVKPGDTVLYEQNAGTEVEIDGEKIVYMRERNVIIIL